MKIRSIIIDDEQSSRENLQNILKQNCRNVEVIASLSTALEGIEALEKYCPDIVFLDIKMPKTTGFDFLESLKEIKFEVIFVTAYDQYALKAIKFCALDYLLKPIDINELINALGKVEKKLLEREENHRMKIFLQNLQNEKQTKKIALPTMDRILFVEINHIIRCEGENNYTSFYLDNGERIFVSRTLKEFEDLLSDFNFIRVHRSHLINLVKVKSYVKKEGGYIVMNDGSKVNISRQRREEIFKYLSELSLNY